jgi:Zn-dependent protease
MSWWFSDYYNSTNYGPVFAISWVIWVVVSITLHELGHGFTAIRCGDDTPIHLRRMTLNPLVHIPPMAWLMFAVFGFTWGLMPVNPANFRGRYDDAKVGAAGPAVNFGLFVICALAAGLWNVKGQGLTPDHVFQNIRMFLLVGTFINLMGVVFNLIPVPPLDGSRILSDFSPAYSRIWTGPHSQIIGLVAFGLLFFVGSKHIWPLVIGWSHHSIRFVETHL